MLRAFLWFLGGIGVLWAVLGVTIFPQLWGMMDQDAVAGGRVVPTIGGATMTGVILLVVVQFTAMFGLVGLFFYLVVDALRGRRSDRDAEVRPPR